MLSINDWIMTILGLQRQGMPITLLAVCPNSAAVLEAAVKCAAQNRAPMLFAATLNQVDLDSGYTGWTPAEFVRLLSFYAGKYTWLGPLYPCLDHGGPWLKDKHAIDGLTLDQTMAQVRKSLTACLEAGYQLLHIDPTVDKTLSPGQAIPIEVVVDRTVELIAHAEKERQARRLPQVAYEVGTEEVHGGLADLDNFRSFLTGLKSALAARGLEDCWPAFIVGKVGTDLGTTWFDPKTASQLHELVAPLGSLIKGHYTDWVSNPGAYPESGMGGANVGPEFTSEEYQALSDLTQKEEDLCRHRHWETSRFIEFLTRAVVDSGRWKKWLTASERSCPFQELDRDRQLWLVQTGARYIWTVPSVVAARKSLYGNLAYAIPDPHGYVVTRIQRAIDKYVNAFHLFDTVAYAERG